jgi:hypothetical protein
VDAMTYFQNPSNGYIEEVSQPFLWTLLFGPLYFAVRGVWTHAAAAFFLAIVTAFISWLIYPFFARQILETNYLRKGWIPLTRAQVREQTGHREVPLKVVLIRVGVLAFFIAVLVIAKRAGY